MPLSPGQVLNQRYRIVKLLGQGGFGAVYRAWDINLERPRALKENLQLSSEAQRQFKREAQMLSDLTHANLPKVIDHFVIHGQGQYLVMEYVDGEDLQARLELAGGALPEAQTVEWISQVCEALAYLHRQTPPVIHRDVKPANIKVTPGGAARLVDFGIAKVFDPRHATTLGARAVSPGYSPQEQYGQGATDARTDIYALGATLYHLLTGQLPVESVERTLGAALPPPRSWNPQISPQVESAILKAMQPLPDERFQSVLEFQAALLAPAATQARVGSTVVLQTQPLQGTAEAPIQAATSPESAAQTSPPAAGIIPEGKPALPGDLAGIEPPGVRIVADQHALDSHLSASPYQPHSSEHRQPVSQTAGQEIPPQPGAPAEREAIAVPAGVGISELTSASRFARRAMWIAAVVLALLVLLGVGLVLSGALPRLKRALAPLTPVNPEMVVIPAGVFWMGSADGNADEQPRHEVSLDAFSIDRYEVTNGMYGKCVAAGVCSKPKIPKDYADPLKVNHPVVYVTWEQALAYCEWRGGSLPSEAQWEKAARGGLQDALYPWGDAAPTCQRANYWGIEGGCVGDTSPVGLLRPNGYELYDMAGNVWEWVWDWRQDDYYTTRTSWKNPLGPANGSKRGLRGGSWSEGAASTLRAAFRLAGNPTFSKSTWGFRCVVNQ
jgi:formylglycine-generating enzyme required for sulfatase activity/serine/threonine protein kinase